MLEAGVMRSRLARLSLRYVPVLRSGSVVRGRRHETAVDDTACTSLNAFVTASRHARFTGSDPCKRFLENVSGFTVILRICGLCAAPQRSTFAQQGESKGEGK
jgi:hypothetical protein